MLQLSPLICLLLINSHISLVHSMTQHLDSLFAFVFAFFVFFGFCLELGLYCAAYSSIRHR
jgi:hypothetical protein